MEALYPSTALVAMHFVILSHTNNINLSEAEVGKFEIVS